MRKTMDQESMLPDFSSSSAVSKRERDSTQTGSSSRTSSSTGDKLSLKQFLVVYLKWIMFFTSSVSLLCAAFGFIGAAGWNPVAKNLEMVAWSFLYSGSIKAWFGLQGFSITTSLDPNLQFISYSDSSCSTSVIASAEGSTFCDVCQSAGKVSFRLSIVIILCMLLVSFLSILRISQNIYVIKIAILISSLCQLVLTLTAFSIWSQNCFNSINHSSNITSSQWTGFDVTIIGFAFGFVQFIVQLIVPSEADEIFTPKVLNSFNSFNDIVSRMSMAPLRRPASLTQTRTERGNDRGKGITQKNLESVSMEI